MEKVSCSKRLENTIYVIANLQGNHHPNNLDAHRRLPVDERLTESKQRYVFYLTDPEPHLTFPNQLLEKEIDPLLHKAGKDHLAEWSFLLAEEKHAFCSYPFFMISSRFYAKNDWLLRDLNREWDLLFSQFSKYSHGFLPSYSRFLHWVKFSNLMKNPLLFCPFTDRFFQLVKELYQISIPQDYKAFPDLGCHYLGFRDREALLEYVNFYKPFIHYFFDENFSEKRSISDYVKKSGHFPNEKPITFGFEVLSHLFFFQKQRPFFCLHYDGYYEIDFSKYKFNRIISFKIPILTKIKRRAKWYGYRLKTGGPYRYIYSLALSVKRRFWKKR
jgi:hypothetical protein